jgi:hypothetical protein
MFHTTTQIHDVEFVVHYGYLRANIDFDPEDECLTLTSGYYLTGQKKSIATKYVINVFT